MSDHSSIESPLDWPRIRHLRGMYVSFGIPIYRTGPAAGMKYIGEAPGDCHVRSENIHFPCKTI